MHTTPVTLLQQLRRPDAHAAWQRFVALYTPLLYHWARRLGLKKPDAADMVQDIFVVLLDKLPQFTYDQRGSFRGWLRAVTFNKWREMQRRAATPGAMPMQLVGEVAGGDCAAALDEAEEAEYRRRLVGGALKLISSEFQPATWRAFWQYVVQGRPAAEVARETELTVNSVYIIKSRVLSRLRLELDGFMD